ncbi:PREDICTED: muscle M-line assembly protein unc-89 [Drosophila arizonae]|uniref:Muscle M-line assembly protein unc-89 n=1 Tax=Drosophila arizonae TaxID=7263 RepID=A0ABM1P0C7_DROAR|nr:PREDICTED: muscle M-line assembly protein unc-89 [Drosophila arizonae]
MERRQTLDSSMSSLYSASSSNRQLQLQPQSQSHSHSQSQSQLDAFNYSATMSSSSPTPSQATTSSSLRATTIGTVVVRCGPIQLVIALLQSPEKIYIKVVELEPKITALGDNLDESLHMQREHDETLRNLQNLPGPMDEFVQKADKLLASKRISSELVNAMADTLNIIWQDILNLLQDRQHILHLCTQFHDKMTQCFMRMDQLEGACHEAALPAEVAGVQEFLNKFKQLRIDMLTGVMAALKDGNELLAQLQELEKLETLDTRPEHIKRDATRAVHQVQQWLEALHDRRNSLELAWQTRKTQLEQCLALKLLGRELLELESALQQAKHELNTMYSLGECEHTANQTLLKYREWKQQALLLRDRALKITRAKEKVQAPGYFAGDEDCARAYAVLSICTEHLDLVDQREHWLQQSRDFFAKAEHTLSVLEKLELELASVKLPPNSPESYAMFAKVSRDVRTFTEEPLRLGYGILDEVGRTQPETQGIKRVLDELENRKAYVEGICANSSEDHQRVQRALNEFLAQHNELLAWLRASGQLQLQQSVNMGRNLHQAKQFLLQHHELMQDLEIKGELINLLLESIKQHLESLSPQQRFDVDSKAEALHKHWIELKDLVLKRVDYVSLLIEFFEQANELSSQLDHLQRQLLQTPDEHKLQFLQATWANIAASYAELKSAGQRFVNLKFPSPLLPFRQLLEKRIEKFTESTRQQLLISNPESESYVKDELRKLNDKWQSFKDQVRQKRKSLNQANDFFEVVEKIDAEYREISYFYNSVSNKVPYLRDAVEASNLVNDIEKYVTSREPALRAKLDSAAQCAHDMNKVSTLYNDVMNIFQSFIKLKTDINTVQERLKQEQRQREQREQEARDQAEREKAIREAEARERLAREEQARLEAQRQQAAIEQAQRELAARQLSLREQAVREEEARLQAVREQAAREQLAREQAAREEEQRIQTLREIAKREEELRLQALRDEEARLHNKREEELRVKREEEIRLRREEESRLQREEEARQKRENESRIQREEITRLQTLRDQVDQQRIVTENIRKDIQVNQIFTELRYASPLFVRPLKDALAREGERFVFECEVTGTPEPSVEWFKDGISIQSNADYKTSFDKGICRLVIEETFAADTARFSCRASNLVGTCDTNATLTVRENAAELQLVPPRILRFLESGKATEGTAFQFSCVVSGVPLPTVQWFKNDKCIDDSPDYVISYNNGEATLRFDEVFLEDDAVYTCSASNPAGIEHCSASLIVEPLEPTELPCFKMPLQNAMARVGQKIKMEALVTGIPQPEICWLHNGKPFQPRDSKYENGRVTLTIPQAYPNDAGSYVLSAKNLAGEAYSSCNIIVKGRLPNETSDSEMASDIEPIRPAVHIPLKDVFIFEGKPVRLDCVIVGQPEPEVIWYHNERPVKESADVQLLFQGDRCSLFIQEVCQEDGGSYKVVAINSAGEASSSCELKVTSLNTSDSATRVQDDRQSLPRESQPKFERLLSDVLADEGEQVVLEVHVNGDQPLRAQWYLTNKELQLNERVTTQSDAEAGIFKLILKNVDASDKGVYTVKVSNNAGDAKCFSHLIVKSVNAPENRRGSQSSVEIVERQLCPEFKELFSDKQAHIDDVVKFECIVVGKPTPKVHWFFNDQPVHGHNFLVSTSGDRQVLTIQQLTHDAVGKISCTAENDAGKATCVAFLNIIGSSPVPASSNLQTMTQEHNTESSRVTIKKQTFTTTSTSQVNSYEGNVPQTEVHHSSAHIDQSLKQLGQQRPEIVESHHYQELHKSKEMSSPSVQQKSFTLVQSTNGGAAAPAIGMPESPTRLRKEIAPRFTTPLTGKIVDQGANVSMEAIYDGYPSPEIKVEKNGDQLFDNAHTKISNKHNRVTIELKEVGVADAGRYAVTASNTVGQSTSTADLVVKKTIFPPVFGRRLQAQVSKKGERLIMEVEVTGLPEPTVTWLKDDKPLKDAGISEHRLLAQGNSYKLIIEKAQTTDSGKYMVRATNAGGEAKSIADCAILEPSPERMQEVVKTIVYEAPASEFKTENQSHFNKEPQSYQTNQTDATTANDLHGLSESKVITEHRCTTEATMRLEHKSTYNDLPELSLRPKTPTTSTTTNTTTTDTTTNNTASMDQTDTQTSYKTGVTQTPPPVPPKPCPPVVGTAFGQPAQAQAQPQPQQPPQMQTQINTRYESSSNEHKMSSSFEYFKKIDEETFAHKRYSLPSCHSLDIHLDRLHAQAPRLPPDQLVRTVPELPNTEPVNAHLNRDEQAQRPPLFITPLKDIAVGVGGTARFECIVQAHPQPQVNWTHNGGHLEQGSRHIIEYRNGVCRLTLPQAYPDDNGSYVCSASNALGAASTSGTLTVSSTNRGFRY